MLNKINKILPYAVIFVLMYMSHSALESATMLAGESKKAAGIDLALLDPTFITPVDATSPVSRDPFDVDWDHYDPIDIAERARRIAAGLPVPDILPDVPPDSADRVDNTTLASGSPGPDDPNIEPPEPEPDPEPVIPDLPRRLTAIIIGGQDSLVMLDGELYAAGDLIGGDDPETCWRLASIEKASITLAFGEITEAIDLKQDQPGRVVPRELDPALETPEAPAEHSPVESARVKQITFPSLQLDGRFPESIPGLDIIRTTFAKTFQPADPACPPEQDVQTPEKD